MGPFGGQFVSQPTNNGVSVRAHGSRIVLLVAADRPPTHVGAAPRAVVHASEWAKVIAGEPVEINPSIGHGFKVMTVDEYTALWKRNDDFPDCLACGGMNTKEHHFVQTWCRGLRRWESETLCLDCHMFSWRSYADPDFATPEEHEKALWESMLIEQAEKNRVEGRA